MGCYAATRDPLPRHIRRSHALRHRAPAPRPVLPERRRAFAATRSTCRAPGSQTSLEIPAMAEASYSPFGFRLSGRDQVSWGRIAVMQLYAGFDEAKATLRGVRTTLQNVEGPRNVDRPAGQTAAYVAGDWKSPEGKQRVEAILVGTDRKSVLVQYIYLPERVPIALRDAFAGRGEDAKGVTVRAVVEGRSSGRPSVPTRAAERAGRDGPHLRRRDLYRQRGPAREAAGQPRLHRRRC